MWDGRLETLPFGLLHVVYQDQVPLPSLTWNEPPSSGWGNSLEMPIVSYKIEASRCGNFRVFDYSVLVDSAKSYMLDNQTTIRCSVSNCTCSERGVSHTISPLGKDCGCGCTAMENTSCESSEVDIVAPNQTVFTYPLVHNVTQLHPNLHQGLFYYYRVTATNRLGTSNTSDVVFMQFDKIPFDISFVDYPIVFPVPVAV